MESGERLASPSTTPASVHTTTSASTSSSSSSSSSTAASNAKSSLNHGATASLGTCGKNSCAHTHMLFHALMQGLLIVTVWKVLSQNSRTITRQHISTHTHRRVSHRHALSPSPSLDCVVGGRLETDVIRDLSSCLMKHLFFSSSEWHVIKRKSSADWVLSDKAQVFTFSDSVLLKG